MLNKKTGLKTVVCLTASVLLGASSYGAIIYDNTEAWTGQVTGEGNTEIGDVVTFGGTDRILTDFQFEYFLTDNASGNETARVFLYSLEAGFLPDAVLYDSGTFTLDRTPTGFGTVNINNLLVNVPDSVAWTVAFGGLDTAGGEGGGLLFYIDSDNPGTNPRFFDATTGAQEHYTVRRGVDGGWELLNHPGVVDNLGARFTAVPEPTTWAMLLGGLATLGFFRRRK